MRRIDPRLEEFATERQWQLLLAWERAGGVESAAKALGVHKRLLTQARDRVLKKASLRGYMPDTPNYDTGVPAGFVLRGQSVLVNSAGGLERRWDKTRQEGLDPDEARKLPDPKKTIRLSTLTDAEGRVVQQWNTEKPEAVAREQAWRAFAEELAKDIPRVEPLPPPKFVNDQLLAVYPVADPHLGMLSWAPETGADYDLQIGERMLRGAVSYLSTAAGSAESALVPFLGDVMHYDSFETVTPASKNALDSDSRYSKVASVTVRVMRCTVDLALQRHMRVHIIVEAGNHDPSTSVFLALCLSIAYEHEPRVTVDLSPAAYHYYRFGKVLIGTHHGHGTKMQNLPMIMATDRKKDWGETDHRIWLTGHVHHSQTQAATSAKDYSGCTVESFRILPPADAWHAQQGYRPLRDMKAIVFHSEFGEVARHTVNPRMLEAA